MKCLFLLNKLIKENALPSILVLASTAVRSTATLAKTQKHRDNLARFLFPIPMFVLILWQNFSNKKQSHMRSIGDGAQHIKTRFTSCNLCLF